MKTKKKEINLYLCDGFACNNCKSVAIGECKHTCDLNHAKNRNKIMPFMKIGNIYLEIERE